MDPVLYIAHVHLHLCLKNDVFYVDLMMNHSNNHHLNDFGDVDEYNHVVFVHECFVMLVELFQLQYWFDQLKKNDEFNKLIDVISFSALPLFDGSNWATLDERSY